MRGLFYIIVFEFLFYSYKFLCIFLGKLLTLHPNLKKIINFLNIL